VVKQACTAWLSDRAPRLGFELAGQGAICDGYRQHRLPRRGAHPVRFSSVDFEGSLQVVDTDLFLTALYQGIGHAKAFGCGLLLVRSVV
jgi:CRISPR system Cascade subunit CasE